MQVDIEIIGWYSPDVVWQSDSTAGWLADIAIYFVWELPWRPDATYAKRKPDILPPPTHSKPMTYCLKIKSEIDIYLVYQFDADVHLHDIVLVIKKLKYYSQVKVWRINATTSALR